MPVILFSFVLMAGTTLARPLSGGGTGQSKAKQKKETEQQRKEKENAQAQTSVEITVTAPRVEIPLKKNPAATTVVENAILETLPKTIGIDEVMKLVPGIKVDNQAGGERVHLSIRGEGLLTERGTRGIKTIIDGIPINDPSGYVSDFYDVDWSAVKRIEILRGPVAAFYGSGSTGGIINILSHDGGSEPISSTASLVRGAYGFKKGFGRIGGTTGIMNYSISYSMLSGDGYRDHSEYKADNAHGKFAFTISPSVKITAILGWTAYLNQNPEGLNLDWFSSDPKALRRRANPDSYAFNEYQRTKRATGGLTGSIDLGVNLDLTVTAYYRFNEYTEAVPSSVIHREFDLPGFTFQINYSSGKGRMKNHLSAGIDCSWQSINDLKHPNLGGALEGPDILSDQRMFQSGAGIFVLDRLEIGPHWGVSVIGRCDQITNTLADHLQTGGIDLSGKVAYKRATGRIGVTWNPLPDFGLYASWGTGFLPPGTEELVNNPYTLGGFNAELVAATSSGQEVGGRGTIGKSLSYDVAIFHLATKNDFGRYRIVSRPLETFYGNVGSTQRYGIEMSLAWYPIERVVMRMAYTYSHFKYDSVETLTGETYTGTWLPNTPQHQLYADVGYRFSEALRAGVSLEYVSAWYIDATNRILENGYGRTDPYALVHVRFSYKFKFQEMPMELILSGRNIFNALYYGFTEPDPDGNSYQPAPTAEWSLGLKLGIK
ncbi:MAG: TonB-dependent receptor [Candidatus Aminicenantes bacterium]|nr:TonB-dependent receptor [Candidatus Aminicenantes bacterium]